jgi:hypothetical protein
MSLLDSLRKGFGYFLMAMGVSRPTRKTTSAPKPDPKVESSK